MAQQLESRSVGAAAGPQSSRAAELLRRADAELRRRTVVRRRRGSCSRTPTSPRCGRAPRSSPRGTAGPVARRCARCGTLLDAVAPELAAWSAYFADAAPLRSAVDAGRFEELSPERAEQALFWAEDFVDAARAAVHGGRTSGADASATLARRAS